MKLAVEERMSARAARILKLYKRFLRREKEKIEGVMIAQVTVILCLIKQILKMSTKSFLQDLYQA